jgi:hypothetical protein
MPQYPDDYPEPVAPDPRTPPADQPWTDRDQASPMIVAPNEGCCPHCGTVLAVAGKRANPDDAGVCIHCLQLVIATPAGTWRHAEYDEAERWDRDARVKAMRAMWSNLPSE